MARIAIPTIEEAPAKSQPILQNYVKVLGMVPNFFALISQSPDALKSVADMHATLGKSLGHQTRERIHVMTAEVNGCNYCLSAHTYLAGKLNGLTKEDMQLNREGHSTDPRADAARGSPTRSPSRTAISKTPIFRPCAPQATPMRRSSTSSLRPRSASSPTSSTTPSIPTSTPVSVLSRPKRRPDLRMGRAPLLRVPATKRRDAGKRHCSHRGEKPLHDSRRRPGDRRTLLRLVRPVARRAIGGDRLDRAAARRRATARIGDTSVMKRALNRRARAMTSLASCAASSAGRSTSSAWA